MSKKTKRRSPRAGSEEEKLLRILDPKASRKLSEEDRQNLILMLQIQSNPEALDIERLIPGGSFLDRMARHFQDTDINYALPVFQTVMTAASWLTQHGAFLEVPGLGSIRPTLWTVALLESGSSKTLATDRIEMILSHGNGVVQRLPEPGSDAQWIEDLWHENGVYWLQDETGKFFHKVLTDKLFMRIKPWMLAAYSHETISNRLKSDKVKLTINDPHFTYFGLSVLSTWQSEIDAESMLDGFCQRMNYVVAPERTDTDMFDHFIYFEGKNVGQREADLRELWQALCAQPGAASKYLLHADVLPFLKEWWKSLRNTWGKSGVPGSFLRRTGYSVMRYLIALQFLLGKSRHPIDLETAVLATRFAEYHFESLREMLQTYDQSASNRVRKILEIRNDLCAKGQDTSARNISRRLGKRLRDGLTTDMIRAITDALDKTDMGTPFDDTYDGRSAKAAEIAERYQTLENRLRLNERKRNERRLRDLRKSYLSADSTDVDASVGDTAALDNLARLTERDNLLSFNCQIGGDAGGTVFQFPSRA